MKGQPMIEIDNDVKRKPALKQQRIPGEFFKSGTSIAPASPPKYKQGKRGNRLHKTHFNAPVNDLPMPMFERTVGKSFTRAMRRKVSGD